MVDGVEMTVESKQIDRQPATRSVEVRLLGPLTILRNDVPLALPASRKVRGLFAYLSLASHPIPRGQLCELLWEVPNDPRGELRWCLSKIRGLVDEPDRRRVDTLADAVKIDLTDCFVDAVEMAHATRDIGTAGPDRLRALEAWFTGDFLEGLTIDRSPSFNSWVIAQRRRFRGFHGAVLERLVEIVPDSEALSYLEKWLVLAPFDQRVHAMLLAALARSGRIGEGEEHLAATARLFESEGLDYAPLRDAWQQARARREHPSPIQAESSTLATRAGDAEVEVAPTAVRRASIAVMPFVDRSPGTEARAGAADGLADDIIARLAKLRSLFVIARGSVFALRDRRIGPEEAGRMLNVDYVASGSVRHLAGRLTVTVELTETRTARIIWGEVFDREFGAALVVLDEIGNRIVAAINHEIEMSERDRAILKPPNSLDAWEAHHRGLWHKYRFNKADNDRAQHYFEMAVRLDPTFARAHAGRSFTHWQNVFQGWMEREVEIDRAFDAAGQSLMADERDPTAHWAMGRALWLRGRRDQSLVALERAIDLSPNFALGHYMIALVHSQSGDTATAIASADRSCDLSPFDPLLFGPGARSMALARAGRFDEAAEWGVKAASRPNSHAHILAIAALCLGLAGRLDEAAGWLSSARKANPRYSIQSFLTAMQFDAAGERMFREAAKLIGMI